MKYWENHIMLVSSTEGKVAIVAWFVAGMGGREACRILSENPLGGSPAGEMGE
jgi:hypothetical protein